MPIFTREWVSRMLFTRQPRSGLRRLRTSDRGTSSSVWNTGRRGFWKKFRRTSMDGGVRENIALKGRLHPPDRRWTTSCILLTTRQGVLFFCARMVDGVTYVKSKHGDQQAQRQKRQRGNTLIHSLAEDLQNTFATCCYCVFFRFDPQITPDSRWSRSVLPSAARVFARWVSGVLRFSGFLPCGRIHRQSDGVGALGPVFLLRGVHPQRLTVESRCRVA